MLDQGAVYQEHRGRWWRIRKQYIVPNDKIIERWYYLLEILAKPPSFRNWEQEVDRSVGDELWGLMMKAERDFGLRSEKWSEHGPEDRDASLGSVGDGG
jgi:hypothetical protein